MKLTSYLLVGLFGGLLANLPLFTSAQSADIMIQLEACLDAAQSIKSPANPGDFTKVEYLNPAQGGLATLEIELVDEEGQEWEFMCNAHTGQVYEIEREAKGANDPAFAKGKKISENEAIEAAKAFLGKGAELTETEYELESDGSASYEFDFIAGGTEWKIEVSAATGEVIEVHVERWEIGTEEDERQ